MARDGLRGHLSGSVPISIAAHLAALLLLLIIPLAADVALPTPASDMPDYVRLVPVPPPPDSPKPSGPVRLAQLPVAPRKIVDARPIYPDIARAARVEGTVMLEAVLDP